MEEPCWGKDFAPGLKNVLKSASLGCTFGRKELQATLLTISNMCSAMPPLLATLLQVCLCCHGMMTRPHVNFMCRTPKAYWDNCTHQAAGNPRMPAQSHTDLEGLSDMAASQE